MEAIENITTVLMLLLVVLQMGLLVYLAYTTHIRFKEDRKTWKRAEAMEKALINSLTEPLKLSDETNSKEE